MTDFEGERDAAEAMQKISLEGSTEARLEDEGDVARAIVSISGVSSVAAYNFLKPLKGSKAKVSIVVPGMAFEKAMLRSSLTFVSRSPEHVRASSG